MLFCSCQPSLGVFPFVSYPFDQCRFKPVISRLSCIEPAKPTPMPALHRPLACSPLR